jgi:hypothetical protein
MTKRKNTRIKARRARIAVGRSPGSRILDATPERLAKSDHSEMVDPATIDSSEQPIGRTRRFRDTWVDRLHRRGLLTDAQWYACDWYGKIHARAFAAPSVVADYGRSSGGGEQTYGIARSEAQAAARRQYRAARDRLPAQMVALVEAAVIYDDVPRFTNGQQQGRYAGRIAAAIQPLAEWLHAPGTC